MNYVFGFIKASFLTIAVLLASQIPVKGRRICDHVGDVTKSSAIQKPIRLISGNLDFTNGKAKLATQHQKSGKAGTTAAEPEADTIETQ